MKYLCFLVCLMGSVISYAQGIRGYVIDEQKSPVIGATVVLQKSDSTFIKGTITNEKGYFNIDTDVKDFILIFQHLIYEDRIVDSHHFVNGEAVMMKENSNTLGEVVVKGERPLVKVEGAKLNYDLERLSKLKSVDNTYDAIKELPGVGESNGSFTLLGTRQVTVVINGKPSTMTGSQLQTLLQNTPVERIKKAEVMYSAPPEYHVRGAVINIEMKKANRDSFVGVVKGRYANQFYSSYGGNANFRYSTPKYAIDVMYDADRNKSINEMESQSNHTYNNQLYKINQKQRLLKNSTIHNVRTAFELNLPNEGWVNLAYTGSFTPNYHGTSFSTGTYQNSKTLNETDSKMHNVALLYKAKSGLNLNFDYTSYKSVGAQNLRSTLVENNELNRLSLENLQKIDRYNFGADNSHQFANGLRLGYGVGYTYACDEDNQKYLEVEGSLTPQDTHSKLKEHTATAYVSIHKALTQQTSFNLSVEGEYYKIGDYKKWSVYPQANLLYRPSNQHMFQFSLSSNKTFPSYWDMQSSISYLDAYSEIQGTPGLRPMSNYNLAATYILKNKYIITAFLNYQKDYFMQQAYQASDRLALIYKTENWNFLSQLGVNVIVPFRVGSFLNSNLSLVGYRLQDKDDDFYDVPFNRSKYVGVATLKNNIKLCKGLSLDVNGTYHSSLIQGTYDISESFKLDMGARWSFLNDNASLVVRCDDVLNDSRPEASIDYMGQDYFLGPDIHNRRLMVTFSYRIGSYKAKDHKKVDTSRFR